PAGDRPLAGGDRAHLLLFYLALAGPTPRERLLTLFWPEHATGPARANLRQLLYKYRRQFGGSLPMATEGGQVALVPAPAVDVHDFLAESGGEDPAAALERYAGPFLDGLIPPSGLDALEAWILEWQYHLHAVAVEAARRAVARAEAADDRPAWGRLARRLQALEPWDEEACASLMRRYAADGDRAGVAEQYRELATVLGAELGVAPDPSLRALRDRLMAGGTVGAPPPPPPAPPPQPESRRLTALYIDCAEGDPEVAAEAGEVIRGAAHREVARWGGHVAHHYGSGVLAWFGYPQAREGAARSALAVAAAILEAEPRARAALHAGRVVVAEAESAAPVGGLPAAAVRLRRYAGAGEVVVSQALRALVQGYYHWEPVADGVWRQGPATGARDRLETSAAALSPLVGREPECAQVVRRLQALESGRGGLLLLRGEAGVGKSRLLRAALEESAAEAVVRKVRCSETFRESPYWPVIELLGRMAGLEGATTEAERGERLARYLGGYYADPDPVLERLWPLFEAQGEIGEVDLGVLQGTLLDLLDRLAALAPVLLVVEDAHWADSATAGLLERLVGEEPERPVLALVTARPEFRPAWARAHEILDLGPLTAAETRQLAERVAEGRLDEEALELVVRFTDGIPLYVEETARMIAGGVAAGDRLAIPETLQDLLDARIHRLGEWLPIAQIAAALGRSFQRALLVRVSPWGEEVVERGLRTLTAEGVLEREPGSGPQTLRFRHALLQEAAYQSLLPADRTAVHARVAAAIRAHFPEVARRQPEWLARHLTAAGEAEAAVDGWFQAGERALERAAPHEALRHHRRGLVLLEQQPPGGARDCRELDFRLAQVSAYLMQAEYASEAVATVLDRAYQLCATVGRSSELFLVLWGLWHGYSSRNPGWVRGRDLPGRQLLELARALEDPAALQRSHYALANNLFFAGDFAACLEQARRARAWPPDTAIGVGDNPWIMASAFEVWALWFLGRPAEARTRAAETVEAARQRRPQDLAAALVFRAMLGFWEEEPELVAAVLPELEATVNHYDPAVWGVAHRALAAWREAKRGRAAAGEELEACAEAIRGAMPNVASIFLFLAADGLLALERPARALELLAEEAEEEARFGMDYGRAERRRREGRALQRLHPGEPERALVAYRAAAASARERGAVMAWWRAAEAAVEIGEEEDVAEHVAALSAMEAAGEPNRDPECPEECKVQN
ncbi:MAG: AAA family ATPase, partial [Thiohalospira sp.]